MARRGENIHKRKDGRWEGRYIKSRTSDKKVVWGYVYGGTYADVKQVLIRKKAEYGFYKFTNTELTFAEFSEIWLQTIKHSVKESTYAHYQYTLRQYLLPVLGRLLISTLDEGSLEQAMKKIIVPLDGSHKPLGWSSARECLSMLRRICKYAAHLHLIRPLEICVQLPQQKHTTQTALSLAEQTKLHTFICENPSTRSVGLLMGMELGLRIGEICGLKWGDIDLNTGILNVRRTVSRISNGNGHTKVVIQSPKTRTSRREIPLSKQLLSLLKKLRGKFTEDTWFLSGNTQKPVEPHCYRKSIRAYLRRAEIRPIRPHTLRHTFATTCLQAGCDIKTLSELLGHANPNITLQRYVHSDITRKRKEIDRIFSARYRVDKG